VWYFFAVSWAVFTALFRLSIALPVVWLLSIALQSKAGDTMPPLQKGIMNNTKNGLTQL
jgi:hypothetical protein